VLQAVLDRLGDLPVLEALPDLASALRGRQNLCVLEAPPGSGKTVLAPLWLAQSEGYRRVLVLVPRRVNARLPVLFLEGACGDAVGYRIRFESRWNETAIRVGYLTYGTALRSFVDDPPGPDDLVIFDEFHERPWEADLLLAHLRSLDQRSPALLLMSATVDHGGLPAETPVISSGGRLHAVEVTRESVDPMLLARPEGLADLVARRSADFANDGGEQLIFLPGIAIIRAVQAALSADPLGGAIDVLHSSLPEHEIRRVVERPPSNFRRILSTDLAESSVTLPGVTTVIDAGLQRRPRRDSFGLGITLETVRAPLSSLTQRAGRAGRLGPGRCHRLLTYQDELHREGFCPPEITSVDGKTLALHLAALGRHGSQAELAWLTPPGGEALQEGMAWLEKQGLVDGGSLNSRGQRVLRSACSPRVGLFGLVAAEAGWPTAKVLDWTYAMEAGGGLESREALTLSDLLRNRTWANSRDQRLVSRLHDTFSRPPSARRDGDPLLLAFADTVIELRGDRALPCDQRAEALLYRNTHRAESRYAVLLGTSPAGRGGPSSMVALYQPIDTGALWEGLFEEMSEETLLQWDERSRSVKQVRKTTLGALLIEEETVAATPGSAVALMLWQRLSSADLGESFAVLARRLTMLLEARPEAALALRDRFPAGADLTEGLVLSYLATVTRWDKGAPEALLEHIKHDLGYPLWRDLETALPTSVHLPRRQRSVPVHYPAQGSPYVASKLQDFFGWKPPVLLDGRLRLACHLLAPNGRPAQITEDLEGFWKGSYQQVRKDLRGRYPKHDWPENPG
jgi:ATP-dependent helicase HrpB